MVPYLKSNPLQSFNPLNLSLFLTITLMLTSEFVPISLIHPMSRDMGVSVGQVGFTISAVGLASFVASLSLKPLFPRVDRRIILLSITFFLMLSNLLVGLSPNYTTLMLGRVFLGLCVGTFWALSNAVIQQVVHRSIFASTLSFVFSGVSVAMVLALPIGNFLINIVSWRVIFLSLSVASLVVFVMLFLTLPHLKPSLSIKLGHMDKYTKRRVFSLLATTFCSFACYYLVFSYVQVYISVTIFSHELIIFIYSICTIMGNYFAGFCYVRNFRQTYTNMPIIFMVLISTIGLSLIVSANFLILPLVLMGLCAGFITIAPSLWNIRNTPNHTESIGSFIVATIQLATAFASLLGGILVDHSRTTYSGLMLIDSTALVFMCLALVFVYFASPKYIEETNDIVLNEARKAAARARQEQEEKERAAKEATIANLSSKAAAPAPAPAPKSAAAPAPAPAPAAAPSLPAASKGAAPAATPAPEATSAPAAAPSAKATAPKSQETLRAAKVAPKAEPKETAAQSADTKSLKPTKTESAIKAEPKAKAVRIEPNFDSLEGTKDPAHSGDSFNEISKDYAQKDEVPAYLKDVT